jgi:subtilisin family serine protease
MKTYFSLLAWLIAIGSIAVILFSVIHVAASPSPEVIPIRLQYDTFDPLIEQPTISPDLQTGENDDSGLYLIQFDGPIQLAWKKDVEKAGGRFYDYIPEFAFIAWVQAEHLSKVQAVSHVRWIGPYHPAYRLAESLQYLTSSDAETSLTLSVVTTPDADLNLLAKWITQQGGRLLYSSRNEFSGFLRIELPNSSVNDLALQKTVIWVEPYLEPVALNDVSSGEILKVSEMRSSLGLYGQGQIVAVADSGLDVGKTGAEMSDDFEGQIVEGQAICALFGMRSTWNDFNGHGTHVSGSVMGNGKLSGSNPLNKNFEGSYAGMAPLANIVFQSIDNSPESGLECIPANLKDELIGLAYDKGARVHNNSWGGNAGGSNPYGVYNSLSQAADQAAYAYQDMLILFSAGNLGSDANANGVIDPDSLLFPSTAKNPLTVGATENKRLDQTMTYKAGFGYSANPIASDAMADDPNGMAAFSSRGPVDDGRIKPDISAPGTYVISARSHDSQAGTLWGVVNAHYLYSGGTSMASPLTTGAAALVREWLIRIRNIINPSAALMKAVLINGAVDISPGQYGTGSAQEIPSKWPNQVAGWGRLNLKDSLLPEGKRQIWLFDEKTGLTTGQFHKYELNLGSQVAILSNSHLMEPVWVFPNPQQVIETVDIPVKHEQNSVLLVHQPDSVQATNQLLLNPGFEEGGNYWYTNNSNFAFISSFAHSGVKSAVEYGGAGDWVILYQSLVFPSDALTASLKFYAYGTSLGSSDVVYAVLRDSNGYLIDSHLVSVVNDAWNPFTWNISSDTLNNIKGQEIIVSFESLVASSSSRVYIDDTQLLVDSPDPLIGGPFRITLVWTDYPGSTSAAKALVNDLDLEVVAPDGTIYRGNAGLYSSGQCLRNGAWDACNNVEGVFILPSAQNGKYTIYVHGINVPYGPQPYALVASGDCVNSGCAPLDKFLYLPVTIQSK